MGSRKFDLLGRQIAFRIFGELAGQDQDAVERRPQFVRHVGKEFGLVLRGQRKLGGLFFERAPACSISWFLRSTSTLRSASC